MSRKTERNEHLEQLELVKSRIKIKKEMGLDMTLKDVSKNTKPVTVKIKEGQTLKGHSGKIYGISWCESEPYLVSASNDGYLIIWNGVSTNKLCAIVMKSTWVTVCAFSPLGRFVASGGLDNICTVYEVDYETGFGPKRTQELEAHNGFLTGVQFLSEATLVTSSSEGEFILRDIEHNSILRKYGKQNDIISLTTTSDKNTAATSDSEKVVKLWDLRSGKLIHTVSNSVEMNCVKFFPDNLSLAMGGFDGLIKLYDLRFNNVINIYGAAEGGAYYAGDQDRPVNSIEFSKSGRILFATFDESEKNIELWDTLKAKKNNIIQNAHNKHISCLGLSPDGFALCSSSWDATIKLWTV